MRDACDLGFLVTCVSDAVYTHSLERHESALKNNQGYCRQIRTGDLIGELESLVDAPQGSKTNQAPGPSPTATQARRERLGSRTAVVQSATNIGLPLSPGPREYIRFEIIDLNGKALCKVVPARHAGKPVWLYSGALALGGNSSVLTVPHEIGQRGCPNSSLVPAWETCVHLPWASNVPGGPQGGIVVKRVFCEQAMQLDGELVPNMAVPRTVCRKLLDELAARGLRILSASEFEFCLVTPGEPAGYLRERDGQGWKPLFGEGDCGEIFVTLSGTKTAGFQYAVEEAMEAIGIDVGTMNCEYGPGQLEITFDAKWGIASPDAAVTFRTAVKEIAQQRGLCATFYSKPFGAAGVGSGGHMNFSLWKADASADDKCRAPNSGLNVVPEGYAPCIAGNSVNGLGQEAESFLAGILEHASGLEALCAPTPGCYGRHGNWAPTVASWGFDDRTAALRVHAGGDRSAEECYAELRMPSSSANPYLVLAGLVAAGLDGLDRSLQLPPAGAAGAKALPKLLPEALDELAADVELCELLGSTLVSWFTHLKRVEVERIDEWTSDAMDCPDGSRRNIDEAAKLAQNRMYLEFL